MNAGEQERFAEADAARNIGSDGAHTSLSAPGAPFGKTTAQMATPGIISRMTMRDHARTAGPKTAFLASATIISVSVLHWALWNGHDSILKERLFGLTRDEGNHGEDVKEVYYYLDATPTHSYLKGLYKYPQAAFRTTGWSRKIGSAAASTRSSNWKIPAFSTRAATSTSSPNTPGAMSMISSFGLPL